MKIPVTHRFIRIFTVLSFFWVSLPSWAGEVAFNKLGEWGTGNYLDVSVQGNYAYCAGASGGLEILDIKDMDNITRVGKYTVTGDVMGVHAAGNYVYAAHRTAGLLIFDVSTPSNPILTGTRSLSRYASRVKAVGNYAYVTDPDEGVFIIDVSNPSSPSLMGTFYANDVNDIYVSGNYVYLTSSTEFEIVDVSNPSTPRLIGDDELPSFGKGVFVQGNYAYVGVSRTGMCIFDVSVPSSPQKVSTYTSGSYYQDVVVNGNYVFLNGPEGIDIIDVTDPSAPVRVMDYSFLSPVHNDPQLAFSGDRIFITHYYGGMEVIDVSLPSAPGRAGLYLPPWVIEYAVKGNYLFSNDRINKKFEVIDISTPSAPEIKYQYDTQCCNEGNLYLSNDFIYLDQTYGFEILDITNPTSPVQRGIYSTVTKNLYELQVSAGYAYIMVENQGLKVIDVSDPDNPAEKGELDFIPFTFHIFPDGNYLYLPGGVLKIYDVSDPTAPAEIAEYTPASGVEHVWVGNGYAYLATGGGLEVVDVSNPGQPVLTGSLSSSGGYTAVYVKDNYAYLTSPGGLDAVDISDPSAPVSAGTYSTPVQPGRVFVDDNNIIYLGCDGRILFLQASFDTGSPFQVNLSRDRLYFAALPSGAATGTQSFLIDTTSQSNPAWTAAASQSWLQCSPSSGNGNGEIFASVDPIGLTPGTYHGTISVSAANASNNPQIVDVTLTVYAQGETSAPFGTFSTPLDGSTVRGSIPVTGWVLDDVGISGVKIYKQGTSGELIYIDDALLVEGARDDVMAAYPTHPANQLAGWGYMLLTNYLPGGDGVHVLHAVAYDAEGNSINLGSKTVTVDNTDAVKPFGAIDTPSQGGAASGSQYKVFGWALTPQPNTIPIDGSTIRVQVNGINVGTPVYNQFRQDIASFFPGYNNTPGAVGFFYLDTTAYENGIHTIQWTVTDDAGNTDGIGSRFFKVMNTTSSKNRKKNRRHALNGFYSRTQLHDIRLNRSTPLLLEKGFFHEPAPRQLTGTKNEPRVITIRELEPFTLRFASEPIFAGAVVGDFIKPLPPGSGFDVESRLFSWMPGPGFVGDYPLVFVLKTRGGQLERVEVLVRIAAKFD